MATCNFCHTQYDWGDNPCKRCRQDNSFWEKQRGLPRWERWLDFFGNIWGIITIILNIVVFFLMLWVFYQNWPWGPAADRADILRFFLAWFLSFISTFVIYATRFQLWDYSWLRNVLKTHPPNLYGIAVILFVSGSLLLLAYLSVALFFLPPEITNQTYTTGLIIKILFVKIVMPAMYALIFTFFTAGSTFMTAALFVNRLNEKGGQPIYMNTQLLADVVEGDVAESLDLEKKNIKPSAIKRNDDGGIEMIINYTKPGKDPDEPEGKTYTRRYEIAADRWGQIRKLNESFKSSSK